MSFWIRTTLEPVFDHLLNALGGSRFQLPLEVESRKVDRLYRIAKRDQWNLDERREEFFPPSRAGIDDLNGYLGVTDEVRLAAARSFSSFYYGEQGAKVVSAQLAILAPTNEASKFLATQVADEARHMEVFEGILAFIDRVHPMNPFLKAFLADLYRTRSRVAKLVGMNLFVEGLALAAFRHAVDGLQPGVNVSPAGHRAIAAPIEAILRDESRHVGFGVLVLPEWLGGLGRLGKARLRLQQLAWLGLLYGSVKYHQRDQELMGLDSVALLTRLIEDHERRVQACGGDALVSTERMRELIPTVDRLVDRFARREAA